MNDIEIINVWKSYGKKLDEVLSFNKDNAEHVTKMKVQSLLSSMKPLKIFTIALGILWVGAGDVLIINLFFTANIMFLFSAIIQALLTQLAIGIYLYQLILIYRTDINGPVLFIQSKLARLESSTFWTPRILFLQLPVWTTFYWNNTIFRSGNTIFWALQIFVTLFFTLLALWLFFNIKFENRDKRWFRMMFHGEEWKRVTRSMELRREMEEFSTSK